MNPSDGEYQDPSSEPRQDERLDSWKEIAVYLDRDVRTVRRWEKNEGLPVHRHLHHSRPTVYANRSEIDDWVKTRRPIEKKGEAGTKLYSWLAKHRRVLTYSAPFVLMLLLLVLIRGLSPGLFEPRPGRALEFAERDWVLILPFENRTGQEIFEKVLEHGLRREISNSRFVNVVPRDRIQDSLKLMKRDPETPIDLSLGREICQRDGEIRALLAGRVEKMDSTYLLSLVLMSPGPDRVLASASREAAGQAEVLPALRYLSNWARETLGEELATIQLSHQQLEKVTTSSFRALQLYSRAYEHKYRRQNHLAEPLLREAIALDPEFASAYQLLADVAHPKTPEEFYAWHEKALELADRTSERERYSIIGRYHMARARHRKAADVFQLLADLYPDDYWAHQNLTFMLPMQGQYKEAFLHARRAAELRPQDFYSINQAARLVVTSGGSLAEARQYVKKARELIPDDLPFRHLPQWILYQFPAYAAWMEDDLEGVLGEIDRLKAIPPNGYRSVRAFTHITLGQLEKAAELLAAHRSRRCSQMSIYLAWIREDDEALREFLRPCMGPLPMELPKPSKTFVGDRLLIRTGLLPPDQVRLREHREHEPSMLFLEAEIALAAGHTDTAIALLRKAFDLYPSNTMGGDSPFFWMAESLASILEKQGRWSEAARVLERVSGLRYRVAAGVLGEGALWLRTQWQLSQLYHRLGLEQEAKEIESELRQLLAYADPDHPIRSRLPVEVARAGNVPVEPVRELAER